MVEADAGHDALMTVQESDETVAGVGISLSSPACDPFSPFLVVEGVRVLSSSPHGTVLSVAPVVVDDLVDVLGLDEADEKARRLDPRYETIATALSRRSTSTLPAAARRGRDVAGAPHGLKNLPPTRFASASRSRGRGFRCYLAAAVGAAAGQARSNTTSPFCASLQPLANWTVATSTKATIIVANADARSNRRNPRILAYMATIKTALEVAKLRRAARRSRARRSRDQPSPDLGGATMRV